MVNFQFKYLKLFSYPFLDQIKNNALYYSREFELLISQISTVRYFMKQNSLSYNFIKFSTWMFTIKAIIVIILKNNLLCLKWHAHNMWHSATAIFRKCLVTVCRSLRNTVSDHIRKSKIEILLKRMEIWTNEKKIILQNSKNLIEAESLG